MICNLGMHGILIAYLWSLDIVLQASIPASHRQSSLTMADVPISDPTCVDCLPETSEGSVPVPTKTTSAKQDEDIEDPSTFKPLERSIGPAVTIEYCDGVSFPLRLISAMLTSSGFLVPMGSPCILDRHRALPHLPLTRHHEHHPDSRRRTSWSLPCLASAAYRGCTEVDVGSQGGRRVSRVEGAQAEDTERHSAQAEPRAFG